MRKAPEMHIQTRGIYSILACRNGELFVWLTQSLQGNGRARYEVLENGKLLCRRSKSSGEYYYFAQIQPSADIYGRACLGISDTNYNEIFDKEDRSANSWIPITGRVTRPGKGYAG